MNESLGRSNQSELRERIGNLSPDKLQMLAVHLKQRELWIQAEEAISRTSEDGPRRLSFAQERLWFIDQLEPTSAAYNLAWGLRLRGALNVLALQKALDAIVVRQNSLRTVFREIDGMPFQLLQAPRPVEMRQLDLVDNPSNERVHAVLSQEARRRFDLANDQLIRTALLRLQPEDHILLLTLHHISADGWSRSILLHELGLLYVAIAGRKTPSLSDLPVFYADFAQWQRRWLEGGPLEAQLAYWKRQLAGPPATLNLPTDYPRPASQSYRGTREISVLPNDLVERLNAFCRKEQVTPFMTLLATFQVLLHRYTGQTDIAIGTPVANRTRVEMEGLIGFFANTLVMRTDLAGEPRFRQVLHQVREIALDAYAHQDVPFEKLVESLQPPRQRSHSPIFQVMLALHNVPSEDFAFTGLRTEIVEVETGATPFDLFLEIVERPNSQILRLSYCTDLFARATAKRMLGHFQTLLRAAIQDPDQTISRLPLLTGSERQNILVDWNQTWVDYPPLCTHQLFEAQATSTPDVIAAVHGDRRWTYSELDRQSDRVARQLRKQGVRPGMLVAICIERSLELLAGLLGIWKAGGAYLPLDPSYPKQRISFILQDAKPAVMLTKAHLRESLPELAVPVELLEDCRDHGYRGSAEATAGATIDDLAYVIYTSGSSGKPKGVAVRHRSLTNLLHAMSRHLAPAPSDTLLATTTIAFDIAGLELFLPLIVGASVVLLSQEVTNDGLRLAKAIKDSRATIMQGTPATWQMLMDVGWTGKGGLKILCGGEVLSRPLAEKLMEKGQVWNVYGPTETTIWSTLAKLAPGDSTPSIGRPLDNTKLYVLDQYAQPVPAGVPGELYIGGDGVAEGYWNRSEMTLEKFVANPFSATPGSRLYRTGDQVRYRTDGNVEFLGRMDNQVKIRGFRIELGEIEAVLGRHETVRQCVVVAREDVPGEKRLIAYIECQEGSVPDASDLRLHLKKDLPDYMVPSAFVIMDKLPVTPNGKFDRKGLPPPDGQLFGIKEKFIEPRDPLEQALASIWAKALRVERVGLHDDFFDLGGHSLAAVRLVYEVQKLIGKAVPLATLFQASKVGAFADILRRDGWMPSWSSLVAIQPHGSRPPLFLMHAAEGHVLLYRQVARHLGPDQPVYGLQSQGLNSSECFSTTIQDMASQYIKEIRMVQPRGPYFLGGYCLGGIIAYELAQQLGNLGEKVGLVLMLDSYNNSVASQSGALLQAPLHFFQNIWFHGANLFSLPTKDRKMFLTEKVHKKLARIGIRLRAVYHLFQKLGSQETHNRYPHLIVRKVNNQAANRYVPRPYRGRVALIRSKVSFSGFKGPSLGWGEVVRDGLEIHKLPVYPKGMLMDPFSRLLAETLKQCLQNA